MTADQANSDSSSKLSLVSLIIPALNTLALLATLGVFYYTKIQYKHTRITEESERARLESLKAEKEKADIPGYIHFDPITVNIGSNPLHSRPADGTAKQIEGKLHYATLTLSLEIRDQTQKILIESSKAAIIDQLIHLLGKKTFNELNTFQGRFILQSQIIQFINTLAVTEGGPLNEGLVTRVYFSQFLVQ